MQMSIMKARAKTTIFWALLEQYACEILTIFGYGYDLFRFAVLYVVYRAYVVSSRVQQIKKVRIRIPDSGYAKWSSGQDQDKS
jgi:hypothetical protein